MKKLTKYAVVILLSVLTTLFIGFIAKQLTTSSYLTGYIEGVFIVSLFFLYRELIVRP